LEEKRRVLLQKIEQTSGELNRTRQRANANLERVEVLQNQIENREALINHLEDERDDIDIAIERTQEVLTSLNADLQRLRAEYARTVAKAHRAKINKNAPLLLLSSESFGKAYKRWQYFKEYEKFRRKQSHLILQTQRSLTAKNELMAQKIEQKATLVGAYQSQKSQLVTERSEKNKTVSQLQSEANRLSKDLKTQQKQHSKLKSAISSVIATEESEKRQRAESAARERERTRQASRKSSGSRKVEAAAQAAEPAEAVVSAPEDVSRSSDFRGSKGRLSFPVSGGSITKNFGESEFIEISTQGGADVRTVFGGIVSAIQSIDGRRLVIVRHGNYYTVYANLATVNVRKGDVVSLRQNIGTVADNYINFAIYLEKLAINPSVWLAR
jgi:septal ring factor EnvC (AmiA/AmiB activator)